MASGVDTDGKRRVSAGAGMRQDEDLAAERLSVPVGGRDGPHRERREARGERIVLPLPEDVHQCLPIPHTADGVDPAKTPSDTWAWGYRPEQTRRAAARV